MATPIYNEKYSARDTSYLPKYPERLDAPLTWDQDNLTWDDEARTWDDTAKTKTQYSPKYI